MKYRFLLAALVVALFSSCCGCGSKTELFNGQDLTGWVGFVDPASGVAADAVYSVKEGNIHIDRIQTPVDIRFYPRQAPASGHEKRVEGENISSHDTHNEYYHEVKEFIDLICEGRIESHVNSHEASITTLEIIDERAGMFTQNTSWDSASFNVTPFNVTLICEPFEPRTVILE